MYTKIIEANLQWENMGPALTRIFAMNFDSVSHFYNAVFTGERSCVLSPA